MSNEKKTVTSKFVRPHSEILAVISRLTDLASANATILEEIDAKDSNEWEDSIYELSEYVSDALALMQIVYSARTTKWVDQNQDTEIAKFLRGEYSIFDELWDSI